MKNTAFYVVPRGQDISDINTLDCLTFLHTRRNGSKRPVHISRSFHGVYSRYQGLLAIRMGKVKGYRGASRRNPLLLLDEFNKYISRECYLVELAIDI